AVALVAEQIPGQNGTKARVLEAVLGGKPDLAAGPDIEGVQAEVLIGLAGMKAREQLLVRAENHTLVAQNISAREQSSGFWGKHIGRDGEQDGAVGQRLHGI